MKCDSLYLSHSLSKKPGIIFCSFFLQVLNQKHITQLGIQEPAIPFLPKLFFRFVLYKWKFLNIQQCSEPHPTKWDFSPPRFLENKDFSPTFLAATLDSMKLSIYFLCCGTSILFSCVGNTNTMTWNLYLRKHGIFLATNYWVFLRDNDLHLNTDFCDRCTKVLNKTKI